MPNTQTSVTTTIMCHTASPAATAQSQWTLFRISIAAIAPPSMPDVNSANCVGTAKCNSHNTITDNGHMAIHPNATTKWRRNSDLNVNRQFLCGFLRE